MAIPEVKSLLAQRGFLSATMTPGATATLMKADIERMKDVVQRAGVKVD